MIYEDSRVMVALPGGIKINLVDETQGGVLNVIHRNTYTWFQDLSEAATITW